MAVFVLFVKKFRTPKFRPFRGFLFSFMASSAVYPIIYSLFKDGWTKANNEYAAARYALTILVYDSTLALWACMQ